MAELLSPINELLDYINSLITLASEESIKVPSRFHTQVSYLQKVLKSDTSGLVNSILDFAVDCALVDYKIETTSDNLTDLLNDWIKTINEDLRGRAGVEVGIRGLAKQYFLERWKNSSLCLLRTKWEDVKVGGTTLNLPTALWFVDGGDVKINEADNETAQIGDETYKLRTGKSFANAIDIPSGEDELIFIQKPYERWGADYPVPFLIKRGIYRNLEFLSLLSKKGEMVVGKALEYIFIIKKGLERLFIEKGISYTKEQLEDIKKNFKDLVEKRKTEAGIPTLATQFDTQIEHLIPEYTKALQQPLYAPIEKKILSGLGFIEIIEGVTTSRKEGILNPKPFVKEVKQGIEDFKLLLRDVFETIKERNSRHRKYTGEIIEIVNTPIQDFITDKVRQELRLMYNSGNLSHESYIEVVGDMDYSIERERKERETDEGDNEVFYAPVIDNREGMGIDIPGKDDFDKLGEPIDDDKVNEKQKYQLSSKEIEELNKEFKEVGIDFEISSKIFEQAPYTVRQFPSYLNKYPSGARRAFIHAFNSSYKKYGESRAFKIGWSALKQWMRKHKKSMPKKGSGK
jgi:hypothetical protein